MDDVCVSCGKQVSWVEFYRCEKCDGNVCEDCVVVKDEVQMCPACAGGDGGGEA
jgi:hypothetical protein